MAEEKSIPLILTVDGSKAIKTVGELKKGIADTRKELEKTEIGTQRFDDLSKSIKAAEGRLGELNKQSVALKDMGGPIGAVALGFDQARTAIMKGAAAMRTFTGLMAATGIGALLVAFGSLMAYFKGTEEGAQRLRVIMAVLGAVIDQLKEVAINLGKGLFDAFNNPKQAIQDFADLVKKYVINQVTLVIDGFTLLGSAIQKVFKGDFEGAAEDGAKALKKLVLETNPVYQAITAVAGAVADLSVKVIEAAREAEVLEKALNRVIVAERALRVERAEANKTIVALKQISKDMNLSLEERIAALIKAEGIESALMERELANERERLRIMEAKAAMSSSDEATLDAIADQQIKVANIEQASLMKRLVLGEQLKALRAAEAAAEAARVEAARKLVEEQAAFDADLRKQLQDSRIAMIEEDEQREIETAQANFERRMEAIVGESELERELRVSLLEEMEMSLDAIRNKYREKELAEQDKRNKDLLRKEEELKAGKIAAAQAVAGALGAVANAIQGESEAAVAARKTLAVAEIAISTAVAIAGAIKTATSGSANPWEMIAAIAAGVATVIANITAATQILNSAQVGGGSAPAPSAPNVSAPSVNPVTTNTTQFGNTEQAELAPIQAYVVETQLTGSQNNVNQIESQATFGGG